MTLEELREKLAGNDDIKVFREYVDRPARIYGDTYPLRREIKALGGKWVRSGGYWVVPLDDEGDFDYSLGY